MAPYPYKQCVTSPRRKHQGFGLHLHRGFTWHKCTRKTETTGKTLTKMYWLLGCKSKLSTSTKLINYEEILKPIREYNDGIQLPLST
jgi:hypothetical protein